MPMHDFTELITAYAWTKDPDRKRQIGDDIWRWYGKRRTVLVVDLSGFSRSASDETGLLDFLGVVRRMQAAARPIVWAHGGEIIKMEADNCFAAFENADEAAEAAFELIAASKAIQDIEGMPVEMCCGLESGRILLIPGQDFFGPAVNLASRLGEDLAGPEEVLVGPAVRKTLEEAGWKAAPYDREGAPEGAGMLIGKGV